MPSIDEPKPELRRLESRLPAAEIHGFARERYRIEAAAQHLANADQIWLARLITREVPMEQWADALVHQPTDVKAVLRFPK